MNIMDIASKGISKITKNYGKKIQKEGTAPEIPQAKPVTIKGSQYRLGYSKQEIMPDLNSGKTYYIAGHGSGHVMEGVLSPIYASAVWLDCGSDEGVLWVSADIIGLTNVEVSLARSLVEKGGKVPAGTLINISCTHSHSGIDTIGYWGKPNLVSIPSDGKDPEYMDMLMHRIAQVCEEAYANRKAGKLYSGKIKISGGLHPKRQFKDRHEYLSRVRFVPDDGSNETWIMNFGAHPNSLGGGNRMLSGEYPYFMREEIRKANNAEVLYGVGPLGGMDAAELDENDNLHCVKLQGKMIAEAALKIDNDHELEPQIKYLRQQFYLPVGNYVLTLLAMRHVMSFTPYPYKDSDTGIAMKTEMTYMTFGDQKILLLPGENFVSTVFGGYDDASVSTTGKGPENNPKPLAEIAQDDSIIVYAVTNDMTGYVVPQNDFILNPTQPFLNGYKDRFGKNHYHETNSMGYGTQKTIADTFAAVVSNFNK